MVRTLQLMALLGLGAAAQLAPIHRDDWSAAVRRGPGQPSPSMLALGASDPVFQAGLELFDKNFHRKDGVGAPNMNADSCRACHQDPFIGGAGGLELNVSRFGDDGGGTVPFEDLPGGQMLSKLRPPFEPLREEYDPGTATVFEQRQTPSLLGAGLIDSIYESEILARQDPDDRDGDGIFGVARIVQVGSNHEVGRFGWKAQVPRLRDFVNDAMGGELGITAPDDGRGFALLADDDAVADPEITPEEVDELARFMELLPPPRRSTVVSADAQLGGQLFDEIGCANCHVPTLQGSRGPVNLYSNLLLHNVMADGFRGVAEEGAGVGLYRTPPLWGISDTAPYLHDGRGETLEQAIELHAGEAAAVTQRFLELDAHDRDALLAFLRAI